MQPGPNLEVTLDLFAEPDLLPVVTSCVENSARAFGMDEAGALSLTLASEEIFSYLCQNAAADSEVRIKCRRGGYYVDAEFLFPTRDFNMRAFNLTASASADDEEGFTETGLLIASRMVDRFAISEEQSRLRLVLTKERDYPSATIETLEEPSPVERLIVGVPDGEEVKAAVRLISRYGESRLIPPWFQFPAKVVDMIAVGDYAMAMATDSSDRIGGAIGWRREGTGMVECHGPYLFSQPHDSDSARALLDHCIAAIVRTNTRGLISRYPTPHLPTEYFEKLGSIKYRREDGSLFESPAYYRHLQEDLGTSIWANPELEPFLKAEFRRLVLPREIRMAESQGEFSLSFSVLAADVNRPQERVVLRPVWWGKDSDRTVAEHVRALRADGLACIMFEMDLGRSWHTYFTGSLLKNGFEPRFVLPYAGKGDLLVFQCTPEGPSL